MSKNNLMAFKMTLCLFLMLALSFQEVPDRFQSDLKRAFPETSELRFSILQGNSANPTYKVTYKDRSYVMKVARPGQKLIIERASSAGVGPSLAYSGSEILLTKFVEGKPLDFTTFANYEKDICNTLRTLHSLPSSDLKESPSLYSMVENQLRGITLPDAIRKSLPELNKCLAALSYTPAFIHGDLHPGNIIVESSGKIVLIDWDVAGKGDPFVDLARLSADCLLTQEEALAFLKEYLKRSPNEEELLRFSLCRKLALVHLAASCLHRLQENNWEYVTPEKIPTISHLRKAYLDNSFTLNSQNGWSTIVAMAIQGFMQL